MERRKGSLEGLKSLLSRYKWLNLAVLAIVTLAAVGILLVVLLEEPIEQALNPSKKCLACHEKTECKICSFALWQRTMSILSYPT